jgi:hypothetical protein
MLGRLPSLFLSGDLNQEISALGEGTSRRCEFDDCDFGSGGCNDAMKATICQRSPVVGSESGRPDDGTAPLAFLTANSRLA